MSDSKNMKDQLRERLTLPIVEGVRLRQIRTVIADPGSPCAQCKREYCPSRCFPCLDWQRAQRKRGRVEKARRPRKDP